ncbi:hypothetical protein ABTY61_26425 [Kitasatospora sp. NPDC096128]|uniref:hypothetical protein n=1 Tax=Kitasatospora sp. NPDC096128 TaxID=3155547 RepID=UPI003331095F
MERPPRPSAVLAALLAVTLPLLGVPLAATAGLLLGGAVHRAVPSGSLLGTVAGALFG